jgi:hypothetical protein
MGYEGILRRYSRFSYPVSKHASNLKRNFERAARTFLRVYRRADNVNKSIQGHG